MNLTFTEGPLLMSAPMVLATLRDEKTKTRRVLKLPSLCEFHGGFNPDGLPIIHRQVSPPQGWRKQGIHRPEVFPCPYGEVGDRLWIKETFGVSWSAGALIDPTVNYRADGMQKPIGAAIHATWREFFLRERQTVWNPDQWRPSIFMPRFLSRITLEVTEVRVERLQDITEADAIAEGAQCAGFPASLTNRGAFALLWDKLAKEPEYAWDANPWVWVLSFRRLPGVIP